ncbi:MAG: PAC2 family protein [Deltaproteobacteria bacterium]|nr:MAG: PAC2 family protein [Deltaproteobacteria bacterium]
MAVRINIVSDTQLHKPLLLAAWPGMGHVALKAFVFLHEVLRAQNLSFVEEPEFFRVPGVSIQDGLVQSTVLPQSGFYYWKRAGTLGDLLFFIGDQQPVAGKEYRLASSLLDFAGRYGVKRVITAAAMPTSINHYQPSRVWMTATREELLTELTPYCQRILREGQVSGMNGLLLGVAKQKDMEGFCFLGEIPFYTTEIENPKASMAVLRVLNQVLNLEVDLNELEELSRQTEKEIDNYLLELQQREQEEEKSTEDQDGPVTVH